MLSVVCVWYTLYVNKNKRFNAMLILWRYIFHLNFNFLLLFDTDKCLLISTLLEQSTVSLHFAMRKIKSSIIYRNSLWALYIDIRFAVGKAWWMNAQWRWNINVTLLVSHNRIVFARFFRRQLLTTVNFMQFW